MPTTPVVRGIFKEYLEIHEKHQKLYGDKSVVFMQVGSFYEIYAMRLESFERGPNIDGICDILNIQVTRKKKDDPHSSSNPLMAGVPDHSYLKFRNILLDNGYTIVRVDQLTAGPKSERDVVDVASAGTVIDHDNGSDANFLVSIYITVCPAPENQKIYCVGFSAIDIATANNYVHFVKSTVHDQQQWSDEVYKLLHNYNPREILIHYEENELTLNVSELCHRWNISELTTHMNPLKDSRFAKVSYQNDYYQKIYPQSGLLTPLEYLGFEMSPEIALSHIYMIDYIYQHKIENVREIKKPIHHEPEQHLSLSYNCMYQLYLIDTKEHTSEKYSSLLSLLNRCKTAIGRRLCKSRLLNPIIDVNTLNHRYTEIEMFQKLYEGDRLYSHLLPSLAQIIDIENGYRKMGVGILHPYDFSRIHCSYHYLFEIIDVMRYGYPEYLTSYEDMIQSLIQYRETYEDIFDMSELEKYQLTNMSTSVFQCNQYPEIDELAQDLNTHKQMLDDLSEKLGSYIDKHKKHLVRVSHTDKDGYFMSLTRTRSSVLGTALKNLPKKHVYTLSDTDTTIILSEIATSFVSSKSDSVRISHPVINEIARKITELERKLMCLNKTRFLEVIDTLYKEHKSLFELTVTFVGELDVYSCIARLSVENVYCKPTIVVNEGHSYVDAKAIRHPLVEKIQTDVEYVPNDVSLDQEGMLLYGTNACGKSTLMKSVGLSVIMAQAGFFVPSREFTYYPYTQIFTRILNNDNIFKGQSSFAIEMSELRSILTRANEKSLVLGDELCSGTEHLSATCIVSAGLRQLSELKASFIFTSHLHQLMEIPLVQQIENLQVKHLEIYYDKVNDLLDYKRTLVDGSGPPVYGLEVCKAMDMGDEFMALARQVQMFLTGESQNMMPVEGSHYNPAINKDLCGVCKCTCNEYLEVHHIKPQKDADKDGIIGHHHKNIKHNLVPLCKDCHHKVTHENLVIHGYHMTTKGKELRYEYLDAIPENMEKTKRKKFTEEQVAIALTYKERILDKSLAKKQCLRSLEIDHKIKMSPAILNKILAGTY